jgi:methionine-R-sulfoxide reductase/methionine-S-sulfoxide reductase
MEKININEDEVRVIYLGGGCFWGLEKLMSSLKGVISAQSGYANGKDNIVPTYKLVCEGDTDFRETVKVDYNPKEITLDAILFALYQVIDPTITNRQGEDVGSQYQTGIYYIDEDSKRIVERVSNVIKSRVSTFAVEIKPLKNFFLAEEYHQKYLEKNPDGYCHINPQKIIEVSQMVVDPGKYIVPTKDEIKAKLTNEEYTVTQESGTEIPFANNFWNTYEKGIYVDIVTGEPLFASSDKYQSSCGWPSFSKPIDNNAIIDLKDLSGGKVRTEVRSRAGNSHLGHVFHDDGESPNGMRYCINSSSLRFIPYGQMDEEGYGYLKNYVK